MSKPLNSARRIACFLDSIGIRPAMEQKTRRERHRTLLALYCALPKEVRREARRRGRHIIHQSSLTEAAAKLFPLPSTALQSRLTRQEQVAQLAQLLRKSSGHCTHCASWGHPKRSWPTKELAETFRPFAGDMSLQAYECPFHDENYHLGHRREPRLRRSRPPAVPPLPERSLLKANRNLPCK